MSKLCIMCAMWCVQFRKYRMTQFGYVLVYPIQPKLQPYGYAIIFPTEYFFFYFFSRISEKNHRRNRLEMECIGIIWNFSVFGMYEHDFYCHISQAHKHYHTTWTSSPFNINNFGSVGICYWAKLCRKHLYSIYHDRIFTFFLFSMRNHKSDLAHSTYFFLSAWFIGMHKNKSPNI